MKKLMLSAGALAALAGLSAGAIALGQAPGQAPAPAPAPAAPAAQAPAPVPPAKTGLNIVTNAGNGFGNKVVIVNDGPPGSQTIVSGVKNGVGNSVVIVNGKVVEATPEEMQKMLRDLGVDDDLAKMANFKMPPFPVPPLPVPPVAVPPVQVPAVPAPAMVPADWLSNFIRDSVERALRGAWGN
jgi:hypothetical protein